MKKTVLASSLLMLLSLAANAWGGLGHRTIVEIAQRHLTDKAKQNIAAIMPYDMKKDATWMDAHRKDPDIAYTTAFHVWNCDLETGKYDPTIRYAKGDCVRAVLMSDYILSNKENMSDSTLLMNLRMIIHFVGDMHCPTHTYLWNPGGQKWPVVLGGKQIASFHAVYDGMPERLFPGKSPEEVADLIDTAKKGEIKKIVKGDIISWAEQAAMQNALIYEINPAPAEVLAGKKPATPPVLDPDTDAKSRDLVIMQLRNAGYRMAYLLNQYFDR